ncbi:hypothetical protein PRIPAC_90033 [Pristionchus pacificus]|uniref:Uncharacterized protein n=1 Tax=Pristionchus pacificus TaxID=54126 RepID=A0A2A6CWK9_PRIPA|nr:hypothetical protein PRIPAC_90033 [Pristionchus pacificus]|eukprot:PDM82518.1 hypothetical protein PRIPAC_36911 [Pristionchus pacificus]
MENPLIKKMREGPCRGQGYFGTDIQLCIKDCTHMVTEGSESAKVCANLCAMEHAHPDREKWVQHAKEIKEIREINKKKE